MIVREVTARERGQFYRFPKIVYRGNRAYRATEESLVHLLAEGPTVFHQHARVCPCFLEHDGGVVGRFLLIHDRNMPEYVQVAFFEALEKLPGVLDAVRAFAVTWAPGVPKLLVGLNGHLNYGAGILLDHFEEPPVFGLPYTPPWYADYFNELYCRTTVSFRFPLHHFYSWSKKAIRSTDMQGITFRFLDKKHLERDIELYTHIDNASFSATRYWYWSNREPAENSELFLPFRHLLSEENLVFAEKEGDPVGFLLWYPDFNELVSSSRPLSILDVLRYRVASPVRTMRLTEVALLPRYRKSAAVVGMLLAAIPYMEKQGLVTCEGGFIFQENCDSMVMTKRLLERAAGIGNMEPYRRYGIFEGEL